MARRAACASLRLLLLFALFAPFALWDSFRSGPRYIGFVSNRFQVLPVSRRLLLATACFPLPAAAESRPATKAELYEIAGAFAKLASTPNGPGAAEVYEEVETTLGNAIQKWESGTISAKAIVEERARLRLGRARARVVYNDLLQGTRPDKVAGAIQDYDVGISIMEVDFREHPDRVMYSEYPDALVKRGLAKEGLQDWNGAVQDYTKAIQALRPKDGRADVAMPGNSRIQEGDGLGMNPLILNFRGNVLGQLRRYDEAVEDYEEATQIFDADGEVRQASLSRANTGLALFGAGREAEAQLIMEKVVRNDPGVTDAHVALAAWYWANGRVPEAESQWQFACEQIDSGCQAYKELGADVSWSGGISSGSEFPLQDGPPSALCSPRIAENGVLLPRA